MMCWMKYLPLVLCYCTESCCLWLCVQWDFVMGFCCSGAPNYPSHSPLWMRLSCALNSGNIRSWLSFLPTAETRQICSFALSAICKACEWLPQFHAALFTSVSIVLFLKMSSCNDYSTWSIFTSSEEWAFLLLGKCHEKWDEFVIKCNWYLHCNSDKDIYLV